MKVYLHSDRAERLAAYSVHVCPAGDSDFHRSEKYGAAGFPKSWLTPAGDPKQMKIVFVFGAATVDDELWPLSGSAGALSTNTACCGASVSSSTVAEKPIEELFDEAGERVFYDESLPVA